MWQLEGYLVIKRSDLSKDLEQYVEAVPHVVARIAQWITDGESGVLQRMLSESRSDVGGVDISHAGRLQEGLTDAFERRELLALCSEPVPTRNSPVAADGGVASASVATASHVSSFAMRMLSTRTQRHERGYLPTVNEGSFDDAFSGDNEAPPPTPPPDDENFVFVTHNRAGPGGLDPENRKPTDDQPVLSTAHIYEAGTDNEVATVKLTADGEPMKVVVPLGMTAFEVVFDDDFGGDYKIEHEPYANPFTDKTPKPTDEQISKIEGIGLL